VSSLCATGPIQPKKVRTVPIKPEVEPAQPAWRLLRASSVEGIPPPVLAGGKDASRPPEAIFAQANPAPIELFIYARAQSPVAAPVPPAVFVAVPGATARPADGVAGGGL
jgi:hypothetical protein